MSNIKRIREIMGLQLNEEYDKEKLYSRDYVVNRLMKKNELGKYVEPREIRKFVDKLPYIDYIDSTGVKKVGTKIPEVVYIFLQDRY
jgi:hypothetical protein